MRNSILFFALVAFISATAIYAQDSRRGDPCGSMPDAGAADAKNFLTFDRFDRELRVAITNEDAVALAFLVRFPLRVNDAGGSISLIDVAALETHFQEVFTPAVRKEILARAQNDPGCNDQGISYGNGLLWVEADNQGYAIAAVNREAVPPYPVFFPKIAYVCRARSHRIAVDTVAGDALRYRAWNRPRPTTDAPDLVIANGKANWEGTTVCAVQVFTFKSGTAVYSVRSGLGCGDDPPVPKGATGSVDVTIADKPISTLWCY